MAIQFEDVFSFEIYFIILRESLEIIIIVSILLAFLKQSLILHHSRDDSQEENNTRGPNINSTESDLLLDASQDNNTQPTEQLSATGDKLYKQFRLQIWAGSLLGLFISLVIGCGFITVFYVIGTDLWALSEHIYEGILSVLASLIISIMGLFFLRISKLKEKFRIKLANLLIQKQNSTRPPRTSSRFRDYFERNSLFFLPFITCLRESLEAFVFIGGIGISQPLTTLPLSSLLAIITSFALGYLLYSQTNSLSLKIFLISTTSLLYLIAAGLFSKGVWQFELQHYINLCHGQDMSEVGSGPGSYDVVNSIWHVNCCNGETDGLWMLFTAIFGWTNSATFGSVVSYIAYWTLIILGIEAVRFEERYGYFYGVPIAWQRKRLLKKYRFLTKALKGVDEEHLIAREVFE
jgi:high-affinity iron transporter